MKLGMVSLGCPKNLVDSEVMLGIIRDKNLEITNDPSEADIIIVNTCGFIESAKLREYIEWSMAYNENNVIVSLDLGFCWHYCDNRAVYILRKEAR